MPWHTQWHCISGLDCHIHKYTAAWRTILHCFGALIVLCMQWYYYSCCVYGFMYEYKLSFSLCLSHAPSIPLKRLQLSLWTTPVNSKKLLAPKEEMNKLILLVFCAGTVFHAHCSALPWYKGTLEEEGGESRGDFSWKNRGFVSDDVNSWLLQTRDCAVHSTIHFTPQQWQLTTVSSILLP